MSRWSEYAKLVATIVLFSCPNSTKIVGGRGSVSDPAGGAHDASQTPLVVWGRVSHTGRLGSRAFGARPSCPPLFSNHGYAPGHVH